MNSFTNFLSEAKDQLDISILAAGKYLTSTKRIEEFLSNNTLVEHKTDGVKITVIKQADNGNLEDYIIAYKSNVLYSTEYDYQSNVKAKKESIGASQFKLVFQHFNKLGKNNIPVGTELFIEYLMKKPTLSSNYNTHHKMVLIGHSKSSYSVKFGKLKTNPSGFNTNKRNEYAKQLKIDVPQVLFNGTMDNPKSFAKGIQHKVLKSEFNQVKSSMNWGDSTLLLDDIRRLFLSIESKYGGAEEGVVLKNLGRILKFQQDYQVDQSARAMIKMKFREDTPEDETVYWNNVKRVALEIANSITVKSRKLEDLMHELSLEIKHTKLDFTHSKKTLAIILDDIQLNAKSLIIKKMRGNNNALIIGKFRVLTKEGHYKLIKRAQTLYDNVVVDIVTSKDTKDTKDIREEMIRKTFPGVEIIHSVNGNVVRLLQKASFNINVVYAGSDRVQSYKQQVKNNIGVEIKEMKRADTDISASKVINNINDEAYFIKSTPKAIHSMYNEIKSTYSTEAS